MAYDFAGQHYLGALSLRRCRSGPSRSCSTWPGARYLTGARRLCLGGGVAANCVSVGVIAAEGVFDEVFVPPAPGDSGTAIGAMLAARHDQGMPAPGGLVGACYLGPAYPGLRLEPQPRLGLSAHRIEDPARHLAGHLAAGQIVGCFRRPLEAGPRALGHRSILASPLVPDVVERLNATVKFREPFRPFAPVVPAGQACAHFTLSQASPFMSIASGVTARARAEIPSIVHANGPPGRSGPHRGRRGSHRRLPMGLRAPGSGRADAGMAVADPRPQHHDLPQPRAHLRPAPPAATADPLHRRGPADRHLLVSGTPAAGAERVVDPISPAGFLDFDDLTLAPFGYDLAKLLVSAAMTYGRPAPGLFEGCLDAYNAAVQTASAETIHQSRPAPTCRHTDLTIFAEIHHLLTAKYTGQHGYRHAWPDVRPWPAPG